MKKQNSGFTLVELIVVIAILAILSVALIPIVNNLIEKSAISRTLSDAQAMTSALLIMKADIGSFNNLADQHQQVLENSIFVKDPTDLPGWNGPYLDNIGTHPLGGGEYLFDPFNSSLVPDDICIALQGNLSDTNTNLVDKINLKAVGTTTPAEGQGKAFANASRVHIFLLRKAKD